MCLGQIETEEHVCAHLESLVEDECIRQVSVLEDDTVTALVALELGAVLLDEGLSGQNPTFWPPSPSVCRWSSFISWHWGTVSPWSGKLLLYGAMQGVAR